MQMVPHFLFFVSKYREKLKKKKKRYVSAVFVFRERSISFASFHNLSLKKASLLSVFMKFQYSENHTN